MTVLVEKYFFCKGKNCNWYGTMEKLRWKADDGLLEHQKKTCPVCGGHWFDEKLYDYETKKWTDIERQFYPQSNYFERRF
jgi:hypothetical protein